MADTAISDLASYSSVATNDLLVVVDVSDTSMAASGTNKKATISQLSSIIDAAIGSTRGSILYRGVSGWTALTPGTSGYALVSQGVGSDPTWSSVGGGGSGTVTSVDVSLPSWLSVSGNPITTSGTLAITAATGQTANRFLATPNGSTGSVSLRAIVAADLPTTGLNITQHIGTIQSPSDGATITFDLATGDYFAPAALGGNRTLTLSNPTVGQQFTIVLIQDATGGRTVTWFSGILWANGDIPILTTAANKRDVFTFKCISSGVYLGWTVGLNH